MMSVAPDPDQMAATDQNQPQTMAPVVQHPMHAMIAPIMGAPLSSARPAEDPGPEPPSMSQADIEGVGGNSSTPSLPATKQPKVTTMSPTDRYEDNINRRLMSDYTKDQNPWGSADNHPGFLGKLGHMGSQLIANAHHVSGELTPREQEEQRLGGEVQKLEGEKSQQALQGAQTAHTQQQTEAGEPVEISPDQAQELEAPELAGTKVAPSVLATLYKQRGINAQKTDASQDRMTQQLRAHGYGLDADGTIRPLKYEEMSPEQQ